MCAAQAQEMFTKMLSVGQYDTLLEKNAAIDLEIRRAQYGDIKKEIIDLQVMKIVYNHMHGQTLEALENGIEIEISNRDIQAIIFSQDQIQIRANKTQVAFQEALRNESPENQRIIQQNQAVIAQAGDVLVANRGRSI